jgi:hypothetical protein
MARQNWSKGDGLKRMTDAAAKWEEELKKPEADQVSLTFFAERCGIPKTTLQNHVTTAEGKRIKLGAGVGKKSLIPAAYQEVITDVVVRQERGNHGVGVAGGVDILERILPQFSREQLDQSFRRTTRPDVVARLTGLVAVQATTTKRPAITVAQQWRWHKVHILSMRVRQPYPNPNLRHILPLSSQCVDSVFEELLRLNAPVAGDKGILFRDQMEHFILGTDEACLMASSTGTVKVLGDKEKKKHEKILDDSRKSITIVRCASTYHGAPRRGDGEDAEGAPRAWVKALKVRSCAGYRLGKIGKARGTWLLPVCHPAVSCALCLLRGYWLARSWPYGRARKGPSGRNGI